MRATEVTFVFAGKVNVMVNVDPYEILAEMALRVGRVLVRYGGDRYSTPDGSLLSRQAEMTRRENARYSVGYLNVVTSAFGFDPAIMILPSLKYRVGA
jgi:hypothetical protein